MIDTLDSNIGITMSKVRDQKTGEIFKRFSISIEGSAVTTHGVYSAAGLFQGAMVPSTV